MIWIGSGKAGNNILRSYWFRECENCSGPIPLLQLPCCNSRQNYPHYGQYRQKSWKPCGEDAFLLINCSWGIVHQVSAEDKEHRTGLREEWHCWDCNGFVARQEVREWEKRSWRARSCDSTEALVKILHCCRCTSLTKRCQNALPIGSSSLPPFVESENKDWLSDILKALHPYPHCWLDRYEAVLLFLQAALLPGCTGSSSF